MSDYLVACTAGSTVNHTGGGAAPPQASALPGLGELSGEVDDPLLDLSGLEEQDLPFVTVATVGAGAMGTEMENTAQNQDKVVVLFSETRMLAKRLEEMVAVGMDGCKTIRKMLDGTVRAHGRKLLAET